MNFKNKELYITFTIVFIVLWYIQNRFFALAEYYSPENIFKGIFLASNNIEYIFFELMPTSSIKANILSLLIPVLFMLLLNSVLGSSKNYKKNIEHGSASWATKNDIKHFLSESDFRKNMILSETERTTIFDDVEQKYKRNNHVLTIGGSGSGKTRFVIKPNLMQRNANYLVTETKGTILSEIGYLLLQPSKTYLKNGKVKAKKDKNGKLIAVKEPYKIKVLNTVDFSKSNYYNPFAYIKSEEDILIFVNALVANTSNPDKKGGDSFFEDAEKNLYYACISFIKSFLVEEEQHIGSLIDMIDNSKVLDGQEEYESNTDRLFRYVEYGNEELGIEASPNHFCVRQYKKFKQGAGKTLKSILISCGVRLSPFDISALRELMSKDELDLDKLAEEKSALFVITSDTTPTFNFIASIMYTQIFNLLCKRADNEFGGELPIRLLAYLDEFANIGKIPDFQTLIATLRSRLIGVIIVLQNEAQLKAVYKEHSSTIIGNCDKEIFLGGKEKETAETISKMLGKETIDLTNISKSYGNSKSTSRQEQKLGRELMTPDEVERMPGDECIIRIRGFKPFKSKKFNIQNHPDYKYLWDDKNIKSKKYFNYAEYIKKQRSINSGTIEEVSDEEFYK